jgi:RHS repeat-associated protein
MVLYPADANRNPTAISNNQQDITYTSFGNPATITENGYTLTLDYGYDKQRRHTKLTDASGNTVYDRIYLTNYEIETSNGITRKIHYISSPSGLVAMYIDDGQTPQMYYILKDHLGSITALVDDNGNIVQEYSYDACLSAEALAKVEGKRSLTTDATTNGKYISYRGYTNHEHLDEFALINMNGRMYDPAVGRMLSPDNNIQSGIADNYNRYSYVLNNPLKYNDPSGEFIFTAATLIAAPFTGGASMALLPYAIGADFGMWSGGSMANGTMNPLDWNYRSGKTWGYMAGGAVIGAASAGTASSIAASGMPFANTAAIVGASYVNSFGWKMVTGGESDFTLSFGAASYNVDRNEWGYLGKPGNTTMQNIGYGFGALANIQDVLAGFHPSNDYTLNTENNPNYSKTNDANDNPIPHKDNIGHSQLSKKGKTVIDWGPKGDGSDFFTRVDGTNNYEHGKLMTNEQGGKFWDPINTKGVNGARIDKFSTYLNSSGGKYQLLTNNCVTQTSRALNMSGVLNIGIHPYILQTEMYLRFVLGVRPTLYSYNFIQY